MPAGVGYASQTKVKMKDEDTLDWPLSVVVNSPWM